MTDLKIRYLPALQPGQLGEIPSFLSTNDARPARQQLDDGYRHGGGFRPFGQHVWRLDEQNVLHYPNDPPFKPVAYIHLRDELIVVYPHSLICVVQPDRSFEVARMD